MVPPDPLEIHGFEGCPFAWRVRLAAAAKGAPFSYVAYDADPPDPRAHRNPDKRSPLLIHGALHLRESLVIAQYIEEAFEGPALQPSDPVGRATMRMQILDLEKLAVNGKPGSVITDEIRARVEATFDQVEALLVGRAFLGGERPSLLDLMTWPWLALLAFRFRVVAEAKRPRTTAYWARVVDMPVFSSTKPTWARLPT